MGAFAEERLMIESLVKRKFASVPVAFEGVPFHQPQTAWARCTILSGRGYRTDVTNATRHVGVIQIDIFVPEKTGQVDARNLADAAASVLRDKQIAYFPSRPAAGTTSSTVVSIGSPGFRIPEGALSNGWFHIIVDAPFHRDTQH